MPGGLIARLVAWWEYDPRMARHATLAAIRQEAEMHPVEKGDNWRDADRVRAIRKCLEECGQEVTDEAVTAQFKRETGRVPVLRVRRSKVVRRVPKAGVREARSGDAARKGADRGGVAGLEAEDDVQG